MKYFLSFLLILSLFAIPNTSAEIQTIGPFKYSTDILLPQVCDNCTYVNISSIKYPNGSNIFSTPKVMTKSGVDYSFLLSGNYTTDYGTYTVCTYGDLDSTITSGCYDFNINGTGRPDPSGGVLTFFIIGFLVILGMLIYLFVYSFGHFLKKDFDIIDLAFDLGIYFVLVGFYILQRQYLGQPTMEGVLNVLVIIGAFTHVFASLIFFMMTMIWSNLEKSRQASGVSK